MSTDLIRFSEPETAGNPQVSLQRITSIESGGEYYREACSLLQGIVPTDGIFLTASGSQALEFAVMLAQVGQGDEVVMPSYTYYSTANAFLAAGASVVFVDIDPDTMTMDATLVEVAVTAATKAVVAVHYGGVSPDMDRLLEICDRYGLILIEDAAQSIGASYKGRPLGTIGALGILSFHATKNVTSGGEGGALLVNDSTLIESARMVSQHGTDRLKFLAGESDHYTWHTVGSSYMLGELSCAWLAAQLGEFSTIQSRRRKLWELYRELLKPLVEKGLLSIQTIPAWNDHNSHLFYILCRDAGERSRLQGYLSELGIQTATHYIPLHSTPYGKDHTRFSGPDRHTSDAAGRLLRLPLHTNLTDEQVVAVCHGIHDYYGVRFEN